MDVLVFKTTVFLQKYCRYVKAYLYVPIDKIENRLFELKGSWPLFSHIEICEKVKNRATLVYLLKDEPPSYLVFGNIVGNALMHCSYTQDAFCSKCVCVWGGGGGVQRMVSV